MNAIPAPEEDIDLLRDSVRRFAEKYITPRAAQIDADNEFPRDLWPKIGELGLFGITVPPEAGGSGLGYLSHVVAMEEISRASGSVGLSYGAHSNLCVNNLCLHGTEAQKQKYLPQLLSGQNVGALAMSEPGAGSDVVGSMKCHAEKHGDVWVANGSKMWITNGPDADVVIVYMRTAPYETHRSKSITAFIVDKGMQGFQPAQKLDKLGMRGSNTSELLFENCEIPDSQVLGEVNDGVSILMQGLDSERLVLCGGPLGLMRCAMETLLPYVRERQQFGQPIGTFELMQGKVADMHVALETSKAYTYQVAKRLDRGQKVRADAAAALLYASESAVKVCLEAIQGLGGNGYINEYPAGRLLRDAKLYEIGAGTNEIRRMLIGRELIGSRHHTKTGGNKKRTEMQNPLERSNK